MSEAATASASSSSAGQCREARHDRIVRWSKILLPSAVGVLIAVLMLAPLDKHGDVSFILDKKKVENAPERMRVETARYVGADDKGQKFVITANRAIQRSSDMPIVDIRGMFARLALANGPLMIPANQGRYDLDSQKVDVTARSRWSARTATGSRPATSTSTSSSASWRARARSRARCGSASSRPASSRPISAPGPSCSAAGLA